MVLQKGVILTKDILARRNWNGTKICSLCSSGESINHLFFNLVYANFLWRSTHIVSGIPPPTSPSHLFGNWAKQGGQTPNLHLLTAATALYWAIVRNTMNEVVFDKCQPQTFLQVLLRGTYWLWFWAKLQQNEIDRELLRELCHSGWSFRFRIGI